MYDEVALINKCKYKLSLHHDFVDHRLANRAQSRTGAPRLARPVLSVRLLLLTTTTATVNTRKNSLLIPLNVCRTSKNYMPWECEHEKHAYEKYVGTALYHLIN